VIGPGKKIKSIPVYPMTTGRNFDGMLRVIDSLQPTAKHKVSTPVTWKHGRDVTNAGSVPDEQAKKSSASSRRQQPAPRPQTRLRQLHADRPTNGRRRNTSH
jgi:hypothetical protein